MKDELKPCPFCGGKAKIKRYIDYDSGRHVDAWHVSTIGCCDCEIYFTHWTDSEAIAVWNRRATPAPMSEDALVEVAMEAYQSASIDMDDDGDDIVRDCLRAVLSTIRPAIEAAAREDGFQAGRRAGLEEAAAYIEPYDPEFANAIRAKIGDGHE